MKAFKRHFRHRRKQKENGKFMNAEAQACPQKLPTWRWAGANRVATFTFFHPRSWWDPQGKAGSRPRFQEGARGGKADEASVQVLEACSPVRRLPCSDPRLCTRGPARSVGSAHPQLEALALLLQIRKNISARLGESALNTLSLALTRAQLVFSHKSNSNISGLIFSSGTWALLYQEVALFPCPLDLSRLV